MVIFEQDVPYLVRFYLRHSKTRRLHLILGADAKGAFHNHPYEIAICRILSGGYEEESMKTVGGPVIRVSYGPGDTNILSRTVFHRIASVLPETWTSMETDGSDGGWGFVEEARGWEFEHWKTRNDRVKGAMAARVLTIDDPELDTYLTR